MQSCVYVCVYVESRDRIGSVSFLTRPVAGHFWSTPPPPPPYFSFHIEKKTYFLLRNVRLVLSNRFQTVRLNRHQRVLNKLSTEVKHRLCVIAFNSQFVLSDFSFLFFVVVVQFFVLPKQTAKYLFFSCNAYDNLLGTVAKHRLTTNRQTERFCQQVQTTPFLTSSAGSVLIIFFL